MSSPLRPAISVFPHATCPGVDPIWLEDMALAALPDCLLARGGEDAPLADLDEIEVSLISDEAIAQVHAEFMDDPTATDVITFQHGEILVSLDTAGREGPVHGNSAAVETLLYIIHGLLHLNGHTDLREPDRTAMHREQETILRRVLERSNPLPGSESNR